MSGKKFADSVKAFDRDQLFTPGEAVTLAKTLAKAGFDEGVDMVGGHVEIKPPDVRGRKRQHGDNRRRIAF